MGAYWTAFRNAMSRVQSEMNKEKRSIAKAHGNSVFGVDSEAASADPFAAMDGVTVRFVFVRKIILKHHLKYYQQVRPAGCLRGSSVYVKSTLCSKCRHAASTGKMYVALCFAAATDHDARVYHQCVRSVRAQHR